MLTPPPPNCIKYSLHFPLHFLPPLVTSAMIRLNPVKIEEARCWGFVPSVNMRQPVSRFHCCRGFVVASAHSFTQNTSESCGCRFTAWSGHTGNHVLLILNRQEKKNKKCLCTTRVCMCVLQSGWFGPSNCPANIFKLLHHRFSVWPPQFEKTRHV